MRTAAIAIALLMVQLVSGQQTAVITPDVLDVTDGGTLPPPRVVVVDVLVDFEPADAWLCTGVAAETLGGNRFLYGLDPNTADPLLVNPGAADPFVSCVSRPLARFGDARFANAHAAVSGGYCPTAPAATASDSVLNVAACDDEGVPCASRPRVDGAIARIAIELDPALALPSTDPCRVQIFPADSVPGGRIAIANIRCLGPAPAGYEGIFVGSCALIEPSGGNWVVTYQAEPAACRYDLNLDFTIDVGDLSDLLFGFGACQGDPRYSPGPDFDISGCIDIADLAELLARFGAPCCG